MSYNLNISDLNNLNISESQYCFCSEPHVIVSTIFHLKVIFDMVVIG